MATVTPGTITTPSTANASSYASAAFTPAVGDVLVAVFNASSTVGVGDATDNQGGTYTMVGSVVRVSSQHTMYILVRDQFVTSAVSHTITCTVAGDASTGAVIQTYRIAGLTAVGSAAVRQIASQNNNLGGIPAPVFASAPLTANPIIGALTTSSSPANVDPPSGWTEGFDQGHANPTAGTESAYINSGFTNTTVTWGSSTGTVRFGSIAVEFTTTVTTDADVTTATVAAVAAVPIPVVVSHGLPVPTTVAAVATIPAPAVDATTGGGVNVLLPSEVAAVAAVDTPTVEAGATTTPTTVAATTTVPTPTIAAYVTVPLPATVAAVAAVNTPVVNYGVTVTPTTVAAVAAVPLPPSPIVDLDVFPVTPFVIALAAVPTPVLSTDQTRVPTTVAATTSIPTPVVNVPLARRRGRVATKQQRDWVRLGFVQRDPPRKPQP